MTPTRILIVDEDPKALDGYRAALGPKAPKWEVTYATDAASGLARSVEQTPDIVIVAYAVDDNQGPQLLNEIGVIAPDAQSFISATEAERPALESTFGSAFQFLPHPCPADRLVTEIQRCIAIDNWLGNDRIKKLVAKMGEFPSLPPIYLKVVNALNSRNASAQSIADAIAGDLAISAKVLQTVNSSYYGFDEKISNITQAVSILGTDCVKNLVLAIQVFDKLARDPQQQAITDELWHHSMSVAVAARRISAFETNSEKDAEEAYTAGLMHDIGKLVLLNAAPEQFLAARQQAHEQNQPLWQAEQEIIGCHHAEIGAYLLARWGMPAPLAEAVALHHEPIDSFGKSFSALAAVHVANAVVHHRQSPDHPGAAVCPNFLAEIGRSDSWENWLAVSSGKAPRLKLSSNQAQSEPKSPAKKTESPTCESRLPSPSEPEDAPSRTPLIAIAASVLIALGGIFFINAIGNSDPDEPQTEAEDTSLAAAFDSVRDFAGITRTEQALEEIFEAEAEDESPSASPDTDANSDPEAEQVATAPKPEPENVSHSNSEPDTLPQPLLPKAKDDFPEILLSGIFYNPNRPLASVNGQIRSVGDSVNGARIVRIEQKRIIVQHQQTLRSFKLD